MRADQSPSGSRARQHDRTQPALGSKDRQSPARSCAVETHYACGYKNLTAEVQLDDAAKTSVGHMDITSEYESRVDPKSLSNTTLRTNVIVNAATGLAANALMTVRPRCITATSCTFTPAMQESYIGPAGATTTFDFTVSTPTASTGPDGGVSTPNMEYELHFAPAPRTFNPPCGLKQISSSVGNAGFSVCLVDALQNSSQGDVLSQFYGCYRTRYGIRTR